MPFNEVIPFPALLGLTAVLGLMVGSFLNVVIYRLPVQLQRTWTHEAQSFLGLNGESGKQEPFNLMAPASRCPGCETPLRPWHNVPVLSYLCLRGRCRYCQIRISLQYPLVELASASMSVLVVAHYGWSVTAAMLLVFTWVLLAVGMIDWNTQLLPDAMTLPLLWLGLLVNLPGLLVPLSDAVIGAVAGYLILWSVYWVFKLLSGKEGMGYGDFKLLAALGAWLGWQLLPLILFLAAVTGVVVSLGSMVLKGRASHATFAFGPYLAAAGWIALLWGHDLAMYL